MEIDIIDSEPELVDVVIDDGCLGAPSARTRARQNRSEFFNSDTLREIARYGGYSTYSPPGHYDEFAKESLKLFDPDMLESLRGFTRRGEGTEGMYKSLFKFSKDKKTFHSLNGDQKRAMHEAIGITRKAFKLDYKLDIQKLTEAVECLKPGTSAGITFPGKKKGQVLPQIYDHAKLLAHRFKHCKGSRFNPKTVRFPVCMAGARGHLSADVTKVKTRLFWIYPAEMLAVEGQFAPALIDAYASSKTNPMLTGKSAQRLYSEWLVNKGEDELLHGLDIAGFDQSPSAWLIHVGFDILAQNFDWNNRGGKPFTKKQQLKHSKLWQAIKWYFINTPILMPDGRMFRKYCGVPSGSWFTQLMDSVINYVLVSYVCIRQSLTPIGLRVLGDDSGFRATRRLCLVEAQKDVDPLNFTFSLDKCDIVEDPNQFKLLGTNYVGGRQFRPTDEWFKAILYPEQPPPDIGTSMSRFVGLWLCGAMHDKHFCKFFEFFQSCYDIPPSGTFSRDQQKWMGLVMGHRAPLGWSSSKDLFWKSIFYTFG